MITHTRFTIADSSAFLGNLRVPGVQGKFEVRSFIDRVKRPRLIVVHESWHDAARRERITPLIVVQFEADGSQKSIEQQEETQFKGVDLADLSRRAVDFFQPNEHNKQACHRE